ncbi:MAG TPA: hypothetical protein VNR65_10810 [Geobacterales bacterium]|nr:hypothetical protein [Geobacterales bacterium]
MKVDVKIVPSRDGTGLLSSNETYELQLTIKFSDAEKATIENNTLRDSLKLRRSDLNSGLQTRPWTDCVVREHEPANYDTFVAAQGAMVEFMAAVADILREEAPKQNSASSSECPPRLQ